MRLLSTNKYQEENSEGIHFSFSTTRIQNISRQVGERED